MNNIRLYLYDKFGDEATKEYEVELDSSIQFAITKQFTDLENPTAIINDWSKSIAIPFTKHNNEIFNHLYRSDRIVTSGEPVGAFGFDPTKKIPFRLINDENVLMTGYVKVLSVEQTSSVAGKYNITLNGELGKIFQELKNITFNRSESASDYYIDGSEYVKEELTADLIYQSWTSLGQTTSELKHKGDNDYFVTDYIGFAPNNSFSDGFDYKSYENINGINKLSDLLQQKWDSDGFTEYKADSIIENGITSRGMREFRSYLQTPYIYFNKLFGIFKEKAEQITGYTFTLDSSWFNDGNPYWYDLIFCLKNFDLKSESNQFNTYIMQTQTEQYWENVPVSSNLVFDVNRKKEYTEYWNDTYKGFELKNSENENNDLIYINNSHTLFHIIINGEHPDIDINSNNAFYIELYQYDKEHNLLKQDNYTLINKTDSQIQPTDNVLTVSGVSVDTVNHTTTLTVNVPILRPMFSRLYDNSDSLCFEWRCRTNLRSIFTDTSITECQINFTGEWFVKNYDVQRSYSWFTLNDLWNNDVNFFEVIINYCKMYRIKILLDEVSKTITFVSSKKFFKDYTIENWSDKVDYSKPWKLEPNIIETKNLLLNYENSESAILKDYKDEYGFNYGEQNLVTNYDFGNNTKKMFSGLKQSNLISDVILDYTALLIKNDVTYKRFNNVYIDNYGDDKKMISSFGQYYFFQRLSYFLEDDGVTHSTIYITDDSINQILSSKYTFGLTGNNIDVNTYPNLSLTAYNGSYLLTFGVPKKSYSINEIIGTSIYNNFWRQYLNDLYSINTKRVTCYIRLSAEDYLNFRFNKFIIIKNQLYIVNKIFDYNANILEPTKIELLSVNNINNYIGTSNVWSVSPLKIVNNYNEFFGTIFTYRLYDSNEINQSSYTIDFDAFRTNIPNSWTKTITYNNIDEYTIDIKVTITPPFTVQNPGEYKVTLIIDKMGEQQTVEGYINIIRDTDMANEMTE